MKYLAAFLVLCLVALGMAGGQEKQTPKGQLIKDPLYPLEVGSQWIYRATTGDKSVDEVRVVVEAHEDYDHKTLADVKDGKKELIYKIVRARLKITSGDKEQTEYVAVFRDSMGNDGVYRFASAGKEIAPPLRFLKLPVKNGDSWSVNSLSENTPLRGVFRMKLDAVAVPAGKFDTVLVSCADFQVGNQKMSVEHWFAPGVGEVKRRVRVGNYEVVLELKEYRKAP